MKARLVDCFVAMLVTSVLASQGAVAEGLHCSIGSDDAIVIIGKLTGGDNDQKTKTIEQYRAWSEIYLRCWNSVDGESTERDMRNYLFLLFVVHQSWDAELLAHSGQTFMPIFLKNSDMVLRVLEERRFITPSVCFVLSEYFSMVDKQRVIEPEAFLSAYDDRFRRTLGREIGGDCLKLFH